MVTASHHSSGVLNSTEGAIFALGSTFYEIMTGQAPYARREEHEIAGLFSKSKFPETASLGPMGDIIQGCWQGKYASAHKVWMSIKAFTIRFSPPIITPAIQRTARPLPQGPVRAAAAARACVHGPAERRAPPRRPASREGLRWGHFFRLRHWGVVEAERAARMAPRP
jgi:hypothetical protein